MASTSNDDARHDPFFSVDLDDVEHFGAEFFRPQVSVRGADMGEGKALAAGRHDG